MRPILEIQNISKQFIIQHEGLPYLSLRDKLTSLFKPAKTNESFWALNDVSFNVEEGEAYGIIGRNGAGKSTLLKILSRITPPTSGRIISRGRMASLLEVGTGFHQELSGRENIFMNGSILGMKKKEIRKRFDEIVDFSGVEKFLDTSLKYYSSGMQLRLAFAVAAHLEPEILVIDEVLAVGDAEFQKKCLLKMEDVTRSGRTILFVSHNMDTIVSLCKKGILLNHGKIEKVGNIYDVVEAYDQYRSKDQFVASDEIVRSIAISQSGDILNLVVSFDSPFTIEYPNLGFAIRDCFGHPITGTNPMKAHSPVNNFRPSRSGTLTVEIKYPKLSFGEYQLMVWFGDQKQNYFETRNPIIFNVGKMIDESNRNPKLDGYVVPECTWDFTSKMLM